MPLTSVTQADSELERLLAKSPDSALHLFGNSSHRRLRLGVRPQLALIFLGPGPPFHLAPGSFYSLFLPFGQLRISTVGLESVSLWHYRSYFVHCLSSTSASAYCKRSPNKIACNVHRNRSCFCAASDAYLSSTTAVG